MWFKNVNFFEFQEGFEVEVEALEQALESHRFQPCGASTPLSVGWVPPHLEQTAADAEQAPLLYQANGCVLLALKTEKKLVPPAVVNEKLGEKLQHIQETEQRKVRKKEKDALREEIYETLLPQAFSQSSVLYGYFDLNNRRLVVNTAAPAKAEDFSVQLRKAMQSLKLRLPEVATVSQTLTNWVITHDYPKDLVVEDSCTLQDQQEGGTIRCQRQKLTDEDIVSLVESGREVVQLSLSWQDRLAFTLTDELIVKSIKYLEAVQDQARDMHTETGMEKFDADFTIMTEALNSLLNTLTGIFQQPRQENDTDASPQPRQENDADASPQPETAEDSHSGTL